MMQTQGHQIIQTSTGQQILVQNVQQQNGQTIQVGNTIRTCLMYTCESLSSSMGHFVLSTLPNAVKPRFSIWKAVKKCWGQFGKIAGQSNIVMIHAQHFQNTYSFPQYPQYEPITEPFSVQPNLSLDSHCYCIQYG